MSAAVAVLLAIIAVGYPVFVRPQVDPLRHADAIVVLGGPGFDRYARGLQLAEEGYASTVLISAPIATDPNTDPDADPNSDNLGDRLAALCQRDYEFTVTCFRPDPTTTRGEALELRDQAAAHGWRSVIVVTWTPHISRARYILTGCFQGGITMVSSNDNPTLLRWGWEYMYQSAGYAKALFHDGC